MRGPLGFASSFTPADRLLASAGIYQQRRPPRGAPSLTVRVRDAGGIDCDGAAYIFATLRDLEASLWITREGMGTIHLTERGRLTKVAEVVTLKLREGVEFTITATGEDAEKALEVCRKMLEAHPQDRRGLYRRWRDRGEGAS